MRKIVLALFLTLAGGIATADTSTGDKKPNGGKAKTCKQDSDCKGGPQRCREGKCEPAPPVHPVT